MLFASDFCLQYSDGGIEGRIVPSLALKQYRNAQKVFHGALLYAMIVGGVAAWLPFCNYLLPVNQQQALLALRMLAPTIFFSAILGVMRVDIFRRTAR